MMLSKRTIHISKIDLRRCATERPGLLEYIKEHGLPKRVWLKEKENGRYYIRDGCHRLECCAKLGIEEIPALITKLKKE